MNDEERVVWARGYDYGLEYAGGYDLENNQTVGLLIGLAADQEEFWSRPVELYLRGWIDGIMDAILSVP